MENTTSPQIKHFFPSGPNKFKDPRVTFIQETEKYVFKDDSQNLSYEWDEDKKAWFPMVLIMYYNILFSKFKWMIY